MITTQTAPAQNRGQVWWARRHRWGSYSVAREISPVAPVDRDGRRRKSGRHRADGCPLRGVPVLPAEGTAL